MAGYSRETERQNKHMKSLLRGETPEKRIFVAMGNKEHEKERKKEREKEQKRMNELSEVMKEARMPWFCPKCKKVMKNHMDDKTWWLYKHCFDCQIQFENKLAIAGKLNDHVEDAVKLNKKAYIKDLKQSIEEWKNSKDYVEFFNQVNPDGYTVETEKWSQNQENLNNLIVEAEEYLQKLEESI